MATLIDRSLRPLFALAAIAALVVAVSGPGYRYGLWPLPVAFDVFRWGGYLAIAATILAIVALLISLRASSTRRASVMLAVSVVIGACAAVTPLRFLWLSKHVPPIHDITTDTRNPPAFVAIAPLRANARNPMTYEPAAAAQQAEAYPGIKPIASPEPAEREFTRALAAARAMGWTIVDSAPAEGRIEASDTTPFFGFTDDIVVRVAPEGAGSRVDVRSLSRIGRSDLGANARRVDSYLAKLQP